MTLREFQEHWKDYEIVSSNGKAHAVLKDLFMICWGEMKGGLLFDAGGPQGAPAAIIRVDEQNVCYLKRDWDAPADQGWVRIGLLKKL